MIVDATMVEAWQMGKSALTWVMATGVLLMLSRRDIVTAKVLVDPFAIASSFAST